MARKARKVMKARMEDYNIEVLMLAGDIYDKQIPSKEAVNLFNDFLCDLILKHHYKVYIISGNHDSAERLNFASSILKNEGLYIETYQMFQLVNMNLMMNLEKLIYICYLILLHYIQE